jgi:hypothetical protein
LEKDSILSQLVLHGAEPYQKHPPGEELIVFLPEVGSAVRPEKRV